MSRTTRLAAALMFSLPGLAMAQAPQTPAPPPATTATTMPVTIFAALAPNEDLSSKIVGLDVYNAANQKIGTIKDVAFGNTGIKAYIIAVGGFLGMGDRYVAVMPAAVKIGYGSDDKKWHATMDTTEAALKAAPEYKYVSNS